MTREEGFKIELRELLRRYDASIVFNFNPPDMKMLEYCNGFEVYFEISPNHYKMSKITENDRFAIEKDDII